MGLSIEIILKEMSYDLIIRHTYNDPRLVYTNPKRESNETNPDEEFSITLDGDSANSIWTPDTYMRNGRETETYKLLKKYKWAHVQENGDVQLSQVFEVKTFCEELGRLKHQEDKKFTKADLLGGNDTSTYVVKGKIFQCNLQLGSCEYFYGKLFYICSRL